MDGPVFAALSSMSATETFVSPTALHPAWNSAYVALLLWSVFDLPPVPLDRMIWIGDEKIPLAHAIDRLDIFLDRVDADDPTMETKVLPPS